MVHNFFWTPPLSRLILIGNTILLKGVQGGIVENWNDIDHPKCQCFFIEIDVIQSKIKVEDKSDLLVKSEPLLLQSAPLWQPITLARLPPQPKKTQKNQDKV